MLTARLHGSALKLYARFSLRRPWVGAAPRAGQRGGLCGRGAHAGAAAVVSGRCAAVSGRRAPVPGRRAPVPAPARAARAPGRGCQAGDDPARRPAQHAWRTCAAASPPRRRRAAATAAAGASTRCAAAAGRAAAAPAARRVCARSRPATPLQHMQRACCDASQLGAGFANARRAEVAHETCVIRGKWGVRGVPTGPHLHGPPGLASWAAEGEAPAQRRRTHETIQKI